MQPSGDRPVTISFRTQNVLGWVIVAILCLIPVLLWFTKHPFIESFNTPQQVLSSLGKLTGLVGLVMYSINLVLSTRIRVFEDWFGGLNRVYIAHHLLGGIALILLAFHPVLLAAKQAFISMREAALLLFPHGLTPISALFNTSSEVHIDVLQRWAIFFGSIAFFGMVILLLLTFFVKMPYRVWLFTHKFLGLAFFFASLHVLFISSDTYIKGPLRSYMIFMCVLGLAAFVYKTLLGSILIRRYKYYVDNVTVVGGNVTQLILRPVKQKLSYKPGQFVFIRFLFTGADKVTTEWHPFSVSSAPNDEFVRLSVKALGDYTSALVGLKQGAVAEIEGAYGKFSYTNYKNANQIWIAGGIGITPFLSMAKSLQPDGPYNIDLYYSVKTKSEFVNLDSLIGVAQLQNSKFRIIPFIAEERGKLTADIVEQQSNGLTNKEIFICGPPPMMKAMKKQFKDKGVNGSMIHSEEFAMS